MDMLVAMQEKMSAIKTNKTIEISIMTQFLDLTYYKNNLDNFPAILSPIRTSKVDYREGDIYDSTIKLANSEYGKALYDLFKEDNDYNVFLNFATSHGIFLEKFFHRELSIRVRKKILEEKIDLKKYFPLYSTHYDFVAYEKVEKYLLQNFALDFFRTSIYNLNDDKVYSIIKDWYYKNFTLRSCDICGKEYRVTSLPDWVYYGADGHKNICFECPVDPESDKEKLLKLIPELVENCGFIPNSDFSPINHNFSARIKEENWVSTVSTIFKMSASLTTFDSWFRALFEAGVLKDDVLVTARGVKCIAKSGNECNSLDEQFIDNWLFYNDLKTIKEPIYPKHEKYNTSGRRRADWLVNGYYIEYFGLAGDDKYDKKTIEKMNLVRELDLKLIALFPEDLNSLDFKLKALMYLTKNLKKKYLKDFNENVLPCKDDKWKLDEGLKEILIEINKNPYVQTINSSKWNLSKKFEPKKSIVEICYAFEAELYIQSNIIPYFMDKYNMDNTVFNYSFEPPRDNPISKDDSMPCRIDWLFDKDYFQINSIILILESSDLEIHNNFWEDICIKLKSVQEQ